MYAPSPLRVSSVPLFSIYYIDNEVLVHAVKLDSVPEAKYSISSVHYNSCPIKNGVERVHAVPSVIDYTHSFMVLSHLHKRKVQVSYTLYMKKDGWTAEYDSVHTSYSCTLHKRYEAQ